MKLKHQTIVCLANLTRVLTLKTIKKTKYLYSLSPVILWDDEELDKLNKVLNHYEKLTQPCRSSNCVKD